MATMIWSDLKTSFRDGNMAVRLVMINVAIHLVICLCYVPLYLYYGRAGGEIQVFEQFFKDYMWLSSDVGTVLMRPWTIITYMFLHQNIWHLFMNMIMLYYGGITLSGLIANNRILPIYLWGGIGGAITFLIASNFFPALMTQDLSIVGSSAGVMGIFLAAATLAPRKLFHFILIGEVQLQYIAYFLIILDIILIPLGNAGGHIAHLGGALLGFLYIRYLQKGVDLGKPFIMFSEFLSRIVNFKNKNNKHSKINYSTIQKADISSRNTTTSSKMQGEKLERKSEQNIINSATNYDVDTDSEIHPSMRGYGRPFMRMYQHMSPSECVDAILDKIRRSSYNSLSDDEKKFLEKASNDKLV